MQNIPVFHLYLPGFLFFLVQQLSGEDIMLPPDVEQMALFSDAFSDSAHADREEYNWWTKMWRYQGL